MYLYKISIKRMLPTEVLMKTNECQYVQQALCQMRLTGEVRHDEEERCYLENGLDRRDANDDCRKYSCEYF